MELLQAHRDRKEGKVTLYTMVDDLMHDLKKGNIDRLVYVVVDKDGYIRTGWSCRHIEALGVLESGKHQVYKEMEE